ncbi:guanylyl cyclase domain-containing protein 1 [Podila minutissima]|uniref:Guanylyl cyclase domain-containing protein 1 n=1 Tax=Podila minutissima TaxID=64525 RepID=A0A9P5SHG4_9FUNG|nr:guanylyl cyclase domain-containing protein 1 [Podila minutissima]
MVSLPKLDFAKRTQLLIPNLSPGRDEGWDFTYYTSTIGVDAAHSKEKFYRKSFDDDQKRVNALFDGADAANIRVIELYVHYLSLEKSAFCNCDSGVIGSLVQRMKGFRYIDPAIGDDLCSVTGHDLERARNSSGTDHDCIVVKVT